MGCWELGVGDCLDGKLSGEEIQLVGSSWAKKMIVLRLKICGMGLFGFCSYVSSLWDCCVTIW